MEYTIDLHTNEMLEKEMIMLAYRANITKWKWPLHAHEGYEIYYFQEGDANYLINDKIYDIEPGDMLVFNGKTLHRVNPKAGTYVRSYINFMPDLVKEQIGNELFQKIESLFEAENGTLIRWRKDEQKSVEDLISSISEERRKETVGYQAMMTSSLTQLLIKIYRKSSGIQLENTGVGWTQKNNHVQRILTYINHNFRNHDLTLDMIADSLHLNKYYMCHCFKEISGLTVNKYLANRRIEEGKKLLLTSQKTIAEISDHIGLNSTVQFSRLFKQYVGVSPQVYRKKYTKMELPN